MYMHQSQAPILTTQRTLRYPKQQRLLNLKKESVDNHAVPSSYLPFQQLSSLHPHKFDVILLDPPFSSSFGWDELQELPIPSLAADPSFVFMWVGSGAGEGLERGREVLAKWNYRRCEDVVWVKTNKNSNRGPGVSTPETIIAGWHQGLFNPVDRPSHHVPAHSDQTALLDGHQGYRSTVNGQLVCTLQRWCDPSFMSPHFARAHIL